MSKVSRYIAQAWLRLLLLCEGSFLSIYLILDVMEKSGKFIRAKLSLLLILKFFMHKLPEMIGQTMPFAVLLATLLTLGLLSRTSELTALRSCGLSLPRIVKPMIVLGFLFSCALLYNAEFIVPQSFSRMEYIDKVHIRKQDSNAFFRLNNIWYRSENLVLKAQFFDPKTSILKGVVVWDLSSGMEPIRRMDAERAVFGPSGWQLEKAKVRTFVGIGGLKTVDSLPISLALKTEDLRILDNNADNFSFFKLRDYAINLQKAGYDANRYLTMMHAKIATSFSAFVMVILAIPFAVKTGRSAGVAWGIGVGVTLGFAYFVINAVIQSYGRSGVLPPFIAAWGANFVFILAGIWLAMTIKE
jgi:lipopolysaccharide export system permease protein